MFFSSSLLLLPPSQFCPWFSSGVGYLYCSLHYPLHTLLIQPALVTSSHWGWLSHSKDIHSCLWPQEGHRRAGGVSAHGGRGGAGAYCYSRVRGKPANRRSAHVSVGCAYFRGGLGWGGRLAHIIHGGSLDQNLRTHGHTPGGPAGTG